MYIYIHIYIFVYTWIHIYVYMCVYIYVCVYKYLYPYTYIYSICVCTNTHIHTRIYTVPVLVVKAHTDHITQVVYIKEIDRIVSTSLDTLVCLLDPVTKQCSYFHGHIKSVQCVCFVTAYKYIATSGQVCGCGRECVTERVCIYVSMCLSVTFSKVSSLLTYHMKELWSWLLRHFILPGSRNPALESTYT